MTPKESVWLSEYLDCLNATEAARRARYKWPVKKGSHLKAKFKNEIRSILAERIPPPEAIVSRIADIATADMTNYLLPDGTLDIEAMREDKRGFLLKKYKVVRTRATRKDGSEYETETIESQLYPADGAQDKLMKFHGLYKADTGWESEIIEALRAGQISPADVAILYPGELARQFFAAAGVEAKVVDDES